MRTFCTIIDDPTADTILAPYGELMARVRHWSFKQLHVLHRPINTVKSEAQRKFGITSRQFNGIRFDLDQAVNGWKGTLEFQIQTVKDAIDAIQEKIKSLANQMVKAKTERRRKSKHFHQVGKKQRLDILNGRLSIFTAELAAGKPRICFGGREELRSGEVWRWQDKRNSRIFLVGSKDEGVCGNQNVHWDGHALSLRLPDALAPLSGNALGGKHTKLHGVKFRYGQEELLRIIERNKRLVSKEEQKLRIGITWLIFRADDGRWHAHATVNEPIPTLKTNIKNGVVAVDLNVDHLAITFVSADGNPLGRMTLPFPEAGTPEGEAAAVIGESIRVVRGLAISRGWGIACEGLEFSQKKAGLREYGKAHARRLSGWSYARFFKMLNARCQREGIDLHAVNPAFTSVIGRKKYALGRAMSVHHSAALVIGRRALGYGERFVSMNGSGLDSPARNCPRTDWRRWRKVCLLTTRERCSVLPQEVGAKVPVVGTAGLGVGKKRKGGSGRKLALPAIAETCCEEASSTSYRPTLNPPHQVGVAVILAICKGDVPVAATQS